MFGFLHDMTGVDYVFLMSALLGGCLFIVRLMLFFIGFHHGDADVGQADVGAGDMPVDAGHADAAHSSDYHPDSTASSDASFRTLSIQGVTAFFMMFGIVGLALRKESIVSAPLSILGAVIAGAITVWVVGKLFSMMTRLQSSGTLDLRNAVGETGSVYLGVPAGGTGKIQITVQDRLTILDAMTEGDEPLPTGTRVRVVKVLDGNILVVEKA